MKRTWIRAAVTATALGLVAGAVALAATGGTAAPSRPVRALDAGGDSDASTALGRGGGATAVPVVGEEVAPFRSAAWPSTLGTVGHVPWVKKELSLEAEEEEGESRVLATGGVLDQADGALQTDRGAGQMAAPSLVFEGLRNSRNPGFRVTPPDPNGDVGGGYYLQMVNTVMAVYDADLGTKVAGPVLMSSLFDQAPGTSQKLCATHDDGDPVVVFDDVAGQWVVSQFALNFNAPRFAECIAVSETSDPTGAWNAYQFDYLNTSVLNDYPKFGVWPAANNSAYFASFNQFRCGNVCDFDWRGGGAVAYERDEMLAGDPARQVYFNLYGVDPALAMIPSDADGSQPPPAAAPNYFLQFDADDRFWGYPDDALEVWEFLVDWTDPTASTFTDQNTELVTEDFNPWPCRPGRYGCVPQKGSKVRLDAIPDRLMYRLQYRNLGGGDQRMVVNHTVRVPGKRSGVRWYQLTDTGPGGEWEIADQGTYGPGDPRHRWMASAAMDAGGNMAIGYSISSGGMYPSIAIAGQTDGVDGSLDLAERKVVSGLGSEKGGFNRWGDYSDMVLAEDGCTFYYTTEYYRKTNQWGWATKVIRFQIDPAACIP
ncbi:MAG: hypothetical protein ACXWZF_06510 [Actinomycetota bacterium]